MKQKLWCGHIVNAEGQITIVSNETRVFYAQPRSIDFQNNSTSRSVSRTLPKNKAKLFTEILNGFSDVNYLRKKFYLRCFTGFCINLKVLDRELQKSRLLVSANLADIGDSKNVAITLLTFQKRCINFLLTHCTCCKYLLQ